MTGRTTFVLVSGSTRGASTNTAVLRTARVLAGPDRGAVLYTGLADLPAYNPDEDRDPLHPAVLDLRERIRCARTLLFCTPEYAGALPGSFKNLLDWLVGDDHPGSIYGKPVAWLNVSSVASPTGGADAHESLAKVLAYVGADRVEAACRRLPASRSDVGSDGLVADPAVRAAIVDVLDALADRADANDPDGR